MERREPLRRPSVRAALFVGAVCVALATSPAAAQGWFGGLFGGGGFFQPQQQQPNYPGYDGGNRAAPRHRPKRKPQADAQRPSQRDTGSAAADKPAPQKKDASLFVDVFGDTMGQFLANGLDDALADRQDVAVVHRAKGPTGLVNAGYFDWPKTIDTLLAGKDKIDVAVMMIGSNDRQAITEGGKTYEVGSDDWRRIYASRVAAIDDAFKKKHIPLIWVGVPITKSSDFADAMAVLNDITRDAAVKNGATYVDTWEAFANDAGEFAAYGPDINGQTVRLRSADGILFTKEGARKLAHFVEGPVRRALDGKAPAPVLPTGPEAQGKGPDGTASAAKGAEGKDGKPTKAAVVPKPEAGPIVNLNQAPTTDKGELAAPTAYHGLDSTPTEAAAPPPGRADDARWPAGAPKAP